jgi:hypothetical protein
MQLNLPLGTVIKAFKVYKIICKYYNQKAVSLNDFKNSTSNLSTDDLLLNAFSMLLDFIADTYDLDNNTYGKDSFHIFKILEEVTGVADLQSKTITELTDVIKNIQDGTKEALTENFI